MSFLREIEEVTEKSVIVALFTVSATVGVGTLTLYQFHLGFLNTLDWFHFTLLVVSLPLPGHSNASGVALAPLSGSNRRTARNIAWQCPRAQRRGTNLVLIYLLTVADGDRPKP